MPLTHSPEKANVQTVFREKKRSFDEVISECETSGPSKKHCQYSNNDPIIVDIYKKLEKLDKLDKLDVLESISVHLQNNSAELKELTTQNKILASEVKELEKSNEQLSYELRK